MEVEIVTLVMIEREDGRVLIQNRLLKYPGISFPGGHVEKNESFTDCAIREVREETGLSLGKLSHCGIVHWVHVETDKRYMCMMYKGTDFEGTLIEKCREGRHEWVLIEDLRAMAKEKFSSLPEIYGLSPLLHDRGKYSEAFIRHDDQGILSLTFL